MPDDDTRHNLISLGRFGTPTEGAIALARLEDEGIAAKLGSDSTATWLNYMGADLIGAELFVRQEDFARAQETLAEVRAEHPVGDVAEIDEEDASPPLPPMTRAFRAAVLGWFIVPPVLNLYSAWLIVRHRLWETHDNWRYYGALVFNLIGFALAWWVWSAFLMQSIL